MYKVVEGAHPPYEGYCEKCYCCTEDRCDFCQLVEYEDGFKTPLGYWNMDDVRMLSKLNNA